MKRTMPLLIIFVSLGLLIAGSLRAEEPNLSITPEPIRYAFVNGDAGKFQADTWMKDKYAGGVKDLTFSYEDAAKGITSTAEGHAIIDENDIEGLVTFAKKDVGFLKVDYTSFRKYYDGNAAVYDQFRKFRVISLDRELQMNMGNFEVEAGLTIPEWPELVFSYERETKNGTKSMLSWSSVLESGVTRKISPTWKEISETVHNFNLKETKDIAGFVFNGQQHWELVRSETSRQERQFSDTTVPADSKIRTQDQEPTSDYFTNVFSFEKWFWHDKAFVSSGYRYGHIDSKEIENIYDTDATGKVKDYANAEQVRNALAYTKFDQHTWVGSLMANPWKWLSSIGRLKTEIYDAKGSSQYPKDTSPTSASLTAAQGLAGLVPDGIINNTGEYGTSEKIFRLGEGISLRCTAIPKTALYTDLELEQIKDLLREDSNSIKGQSVPSAGDIWNRVNATQVGKGIAKVGARFSPWRFMDATSEVSHRQTNNDFGNQNTTYKPSSYGTANSIFMTYQNTSTNEVSSRITLRPCRWFQPSARYQLRGDQYISGFAAQETESKANMLSNIYTFDVTVQPLPDLLATGSYSRQDAYVQTLARHSRTVQTPAFNSGSSSWLLSADYTLNPKTVLTGATTYSRASNFNDFSNIGLPLGADYTDVTVTGGVRLSPREDLTISPKYTYYRFAPNANVSASGYEAHVVWLDFTLKWPFIKDMGNLVRPKQKKA